MGAESSAISSHVGVLSHFEGVPGPGGKVAKSPKSPHEKSHYRDAAFLQEFTRLALNEALGHEAHTLVHDDHRRRETRRLLGRRTITRWYDRHVAPPAKRHRIGALWRDTTPRLQTEFAHYALYRFGEVSSFTLNLGSDVEAIALSKGVGAKRYMADRISYHLQAALGRKFQFWFVLQETDPPGRRLHLHGALCFNHNKESDVKAALRAAGGEWKAARGREYQPDIDPIPSDNGWVTYAFLKCSVARKRPKTGSWHDSPSTMTQDLKAAAKCLYEEMRNGVALSGGGVRAKPLH
jgi:hypothetical protein